MMDAYIAALYCPMACVEVVFATCRASGRVFAVCTSCGCAWLEPQYETWRLGDVANCVVNYHEYAPMGFTLATREEVHRAGFETLVVEIQDGAAWAADFARFHAKYYADRT